MRVDGLKIQEFGWVTDSTDEFGLATGTRDETFSASAASVSDKFGSVTDRRDETFTFLASAASVSSVAFLFWPVHLYFGMPCFIEFVTVATLLFSRFINRPGFNGGGPWMFCLVIIFFLVSLKCPSAYMRPLFCQSTFILTE